VATFLGGIIVNIPYVFKRCTKCGELLVANTNNFRKTKGGKYGLRSSCKRCEKQYREQNRDKILERSKQYRQNNKYKIKQYYENNKDKILECNRQYRQNNKEKIAELNKQYYENNKDKIAELNKQYRQNNKDKILKQKRQYYRDNRDKILEYNKQYYKTSQGQVNQFNAGSKRRMRKQNQGNGITSNQWFEMMNYFDWKCAYSGKYIGGKGEHRNIDHITPLSKGGEHEIWNVVPMYDSYNFSKHDKDMLTWYKEQTFFSEERLNKIYEWQEYAFNKWGYEILDIKEI
jgi:hypothetical protein